MPVNAGPHYKYARNRWLESQDEATQTAWIVQETRLKDAGVEFIERENQLCAEFGLTDDVLEPLVAEFKVASARKRKKAKVAAEEKAAALESSVESPTGSAQDVANVIWASEHIADDSVARKDAPTATAWGLLCWARKSPDQFYGNLYRNVVLPSRKEIETVRDAADDVERQVKALEKLRAVLTP